MTMDVNVHRPAPMQTPVTGLLRGYDPYRAGIKRALDVALVVLVAPVAFGLIALLALLVALDGASPFYTQLRVGKGGRNFRMLKLRTMIPDAEAALGTYLAANPEARVEWDAYQKLQNDPRVTWVGRLLRATSLDELPQLWNVLVGDMSLVGPRPMLPSQRADYPGQAYYRLRPGLTGPWQISTRNESTFAERAEYDGAYDRRMSLWTDLAIIVATPAVVLRATGR